MTTKRLAKYYLASIALTSCFVLCMKYLVPVSWINAPITQDFVSSVAFVVPAIDKLIEIAPDSTHYWRLFYAVFWILSPIHFALGLFDVFLVRKNWLIQQKNRTYGENTVVAIFLLLWVVFFMFNPLSGKSSIFNVRTEFFPLLLIYWVSLASSFSFLALFVGAAIIRYKNTRY